MTSADIMNLPWLRLPTHPTNQGHLRGTDLVAHCGRELPLDDDGAVVEERFHAFDPPRYLCQRCLVLAMKEEEAAA